MLRCGCVRKYLLGLGTCRSSFMSSPSRVMSKPCRRSSAGHLEISLGASEKRASRRHLSDRGPSEVSRCTYSYQKIMSRQYFSIIDATITRHEVILGDWTRATECDSIRSNCAIGTNPECWCLDIPQILHPGFEKDSIRTLQSLSVMCTHIAPERGTSCFHLRQQRFGFDREKEPRSRSRTHGQLLDLSTFYAPERRRRTKCHHSHPSE